MTIQEIKADLREIQYYYAKQKEFEGASRIVGVSKITEKAERYNAAIRNAPLILYDLYVSLYVNNNTQLVVALDWDRSVDYIKQLHRKLCQFLQNELKGGDEGEN